MRKNDERDLMLRLGLQATGRQPRRRRIAQFAAGAVAIASLGLALPETRLRQTEGSALEEVLAHGKRSRELRTIGISTHARLVFSKNIGDQRVAVGDDDVLGLEVLGGRELMLRGRSVGSTTLTVWFEDGTIEQFLFTVRRDTSMLDAALHEVHPNITAELAPDRDAMVLMGDVPDRSLAVEAQQVAVKYLSAGQGERAEVINLIRSEGGLADIADVIREAIRGELDCNDVTVRRVTQIEYAGEADILVLNGTVPNQTKLTQALTLASRLFLQQDLVRRRLEGEYEEVTEVLVTGETRTTRRPLRLLRAWEDIQVAADESGALLLPGGNDLGGVGGLGRGTQGAGANLGRLLQNEIESNIGRAEALELANGRILSFIEVEDLPQVRVDIRLLEVDRRALLDWETSFETLYNSSDTFPAPSADTDVRNLLSFLQGKLTEQFTLSSEDFALDMLFGLLETEGIARTLSSPSITVLSGEIAAFNVGGQIPVENTVFAGTGVASGNVQFVDFGVNLAVRPLIDEDDYITLDIVPSVSNPDAALTAEIAASSGTNPPTTALSRRAMRTTSRLRDGQSLLIGGLTEHSRRDESGQTPWISNVPLLGWLFKDFTYADADRDLVIVMSPTIVRDRPELADLWIYPPLGEFFAEVCNDARDEQALDQVDDGLQPAKEPDEPEVVEEAEAAEGPEGKTWR